MDFDENKKKQLYALGEVTAKLPILGLLAKCYEFLTANILPGTSITPFEFERVFENVVIGPGGINLLIYDPDIDTFCLCDIVKIDLNDIVKMDQESGPMNPWGNPSFNIESRLHIRVRYGGSGQELYDMNELLRAYIIKGWSELDPRNGTRPVNHLTPYDLCALGNLSELGNRLAWFLKYMLDYRSPYHANMRLTGATVTDKPDIMSICLFYNLTMQYFASIIKLPFDPEVQKGYLVRSWVHFHEVRVDDEVLIPMKAMYEKYGEELDTNMIRVIPNEVAPEIGFLLLTSAYIIQ